MSSIQGITLTQLPIASNIQDTSLTYICDPSGNPSDLQASMSLLASYIGNALIKDNSTTDNSKVYSIDKIISLLQSVQPTIGEIKYFSGQPSSHWLLCNGNNVLINSYPELFAIFGTMFGGDGITTFALPDLKGRMLMSSGTVAGGSVNRTSGNYYGSETSILSSANLPHGTTTSGGSNYGALPLTTVTAPTMAVSIIPPVCVAGSFYIFAKNIF